MDNIVLIGMMGSGKTSVGRAISKKAGIAFIDTDAVIEAHRGMTIPHIFEHYGEAHFRSLEAEIAQQVASYTNTVIATGGGIVLNSRNMAFLRTSGFVVYLRCSPTQLYERTAKDHNRPLLNATNERLMKLETLLSQREHLYTQYSDFILDSDHASVDELSEMILERLNENISD